MIGKLKFSHLLASVLLLSFASCGTPRLIETPFGDFPKIRVQQVPSGSCITRNEDGSVTVSRPDETVISIARTGPKVARLEPKVSRPIFKGFPICKRTWFNYAKMTLPADEEVCAFKACYTVPCTPTGDLLSPACDDRSPILYYFIGLQDQLKAPFTLLQPVLAYNGNTVDGEWSLAVWIYCEGLGLPILSPPIRGISPGDKIEASIVKTDPDTYQITGKLNGNKSVYLCYKPIESQVFHEPAVTLEVMGIDNCDQFARGPMTFSNLQMRDTKGRPIQMRWRCVGDGNACGTKLTVRENEITIEQNASAADY